MMPVLTGRNQARQVRMQWLRERLRYKSSAFQRFYDAEETIFIHIPKNGGTSISSVFYGADPWHWTASDLYRINRKKYSRYFKFAVSRNPFDRLYSTYRYAAIDVSRFASSPLKFITKFPDFESFVMEGMSEEIAHRHYFIGLQVNNLVLPSGRIDPTIRIGKLEDVSAFLADLAREFPRLKAVGVENVSPGRQPLQQVYTREMVERVQHLYADDLQKFGYEFAGSH